MVELEEYWCVGCDWVLCVCVFMWVWWLWWWWLILAVVVVVVDFGSGFLDFGYCSGFIILLWCIYYFIMFFILFIVLNAKLKSLMLGVL